MSKKACYQLLQRYLEGKCTEAEKALVEQWYAMLDDESLPGITPATLDTIGEKLWDKINTRPPIIRRAWVKAAMAAAVVGIIVAIAFLFRDDGNKPLAATYSLSGVATKQTVNHTHQPLTLWLEDSSQVILQPGASLRYPAQFAGDKRQVLLKGAAFFNIAARSTQPFEVWSDNIIVHVLGTSFTVSTGRPGSRPEVVVRTGKVSVQAIPQSAGRKSRRVHVRPVMLTPNQKAVFYADKGVFEHTLAEAPVPVLPENAVNMPAAASFVFREAAIRSVLEQLERTYGITIQVENTQLYNCTFTGDISREGLYDKLLFICQSINATYEIKGTSIAINGKGCNTP